jgi:(5-formylfuran-3-yl)methyl phosphate synthase
MLLVSVRSEDEARAAVAGGAAIIDVKEPSHGSLGMAPSSTWRRVREVVPPATMVSVALGELSEWLATEPVTIPDQDWNGIDLRKVGLAEAGPSWRDRWRQLRSRMPGHSTTRPEDRPSWVAVAYLDWEAARAPDPISIIDAAATIDACPGILFDTWDKSRRAAFGAEVHRWIGLAKESGLFVAMAGSLDEAAIRRLRPIGPDIFAVRGAACRGGDRNGSIDRDRVARLVEAAGP